MKQKPADPASNPQAEINALVRNLRTTELRLQKLMVGEVDAVIHPGGHAYLLHKAQKKLQQSEAVQRELAETQMAILNAMPANVALVDSHGVILTVNDAWQGFAAGNGMQGPDFFVGQNYLQICESATGDCSGDAHAAAAGIRRVLQGEVNDFNLEYPCHSPTEQRWFRLMVTPVREDQLSGAVVMHVDITSRKLAENALRASEERFRNMFTAAATGIAISTPHGRFLEVNAAYCQMLGYSEEELLARDFASLTHPDDLALNLKRRDEVLAGERESFVMEKRYLKKNGDIVWTRHSVSAVRDAAGEILNLAVIAEDITERKLADNRLDRLNRLHTVLSRINEAIVRVHDRQELFEAVCRILVEDGELRMAYVALVDAQARVARPVASWGEGRDYLREPVSLIPLDGSLLGRGTVGVALRTGVHDICNDIANDARMKPWHKGTLKHGLLAKASFPLRLRGDTIGALVLYAGETGYFQADEIALMVSIANDVSFALGVLEKERERQQSEKALQYSEERLRLITNLVPHGIFVKDSYGRHIFANPALAEIAGLTVEEIIGKDDFDLVADRAEAEAYRADDRAVIESGKKKVIAEELRTDLSGRTRYLNTIKIPFTVAETGEPAVLGICIDITERRRTEEERRQRQTELQVLFDLMPAMVWFKDTQNGILRINRQAAKATGKPIEELEGRSMYEIYPQTAAKYYADDLEVINSRVPRLAIIETLPTEDGRQIWVQTDKVPVLDRDGKVYGIVVMVQDITERKQAEEKLTLFRTLIEGSPDAIEVIDPETGRYLDVNETECRILGYSREEMLSLKVADIDVEQDYHVLWPVVVEEIKKAGFATIVGRHRKKDGSTYPVEVNARYVNLNQGYLVAVVRDVTERKAAEARMRRLIDSNVQGVFFWNTDGRIFEANDALLSMVGYTRDDLKAGHVNWAAMTPPELAEQDQRALKELSTKGVCVPFEKEFIRKDGSRVPILIGAAMFEDKPEDGVCFVLDLSERKRAESRTRRLIDSNMHGVVFGNKRGDITEANDAFLRLVGYSREDLQAGRVRWKEITPPEYNHLDLRAAEEIAETGVCQTYEKEYIRKDGSRVPVLIGGASFEDNPDEGVRFVLDLTERKKLEQQFFRAQRMESIGTLAGGIAHDLNNILAPILMSIHLLHEFSDDPQTKDILETIEVSAKRGADIVRQVLSFARGVEGERIEVQPAHLLKDLEHIVKDTFPKDIRLKFSIPNNAWTIFGDPTQIHQILLNLCVNARDAMPNGGSLTVAVANSTLDEQYVSMNPQAKAGRYVQISVTDSGMGMPRNIIDKIFEPFFTTKEMNKGTGLGLSTVMAIVKSHEGIINVYSEPGKGTTFKVYLPAVDTSPRGGKQTSSKVNLVRGKGETILLVDDEASIIAITTKTLQSFGYRVLTAGDGAEGVAIYAANQNAIAVVITDITMPVMDGVAMIHALRRINPEVKVIAASGLNSNGSANRVAIPGVKHFLTKPYTAETLLRVLRSILDETPTGPSH
jgi:PAS domain S-box-containing protein